MLDRFVADGVTKLSGQKQSAEVSKVAKSSENVRGEV